MVIKWRNKYSGEEGFVKPYVATTGVLKTRLIITKYDSMLRHLLQKGSSQLVSYDEAEANDFFITE